MCAGVCLVLPAGLEDYFDDVAARVFRSQLRYCIDTSLYQLTIFNKLLQIYIF